MRSRARATFTLLISVAVRDFCVPLPPAAAFIRRYISSLFGIKKTKKTQANLYLQIERQTGGGAGKVQT